MTECKKIELAIRRVLAHSRIQPHEPSAENLFKELADELANESTHGENRQKENTDGR